MQGVYRLVEFFFIECVQILLMQLALGLAEQRKAKEKNVIPNLIKGALQDS